MSLPNVDAVHKVSIIPRGIGALGYTIQRPTEDRFLMNRSELENKMAVLLGGRAAETVVFGEISTGAADDLAKATDIARSMVTKFGMADELGQIAYEEEPPNFLGLPSALAGRDRRYSEETARKIDNAVRALVDKAFETAADILKVKRATLDTAASELLKKETLGGDELKRIVGQEARPTISPKTALTSAKGT